MATQVESEPLQNASVTSLVSGIIDDAQRLMRQQLALFQVELKHDAQRYLTESMWLIAGIVLSLVGGIVLVMALGFLLPAIWPALPTWAGFAIAGGVVAGIGVGIAIASTARISEVKPLDQTVEGLKETIQWQTKT